MAISAWGLMKWIGLALGLAAFAVWAVLFVVTRVEMQQAKSSAERLAGASPVRKQYSAVAVVYFSRSGNTALAAAHLAEKFNARLYRLEAHDYELGLAGIANALSDARKQGARIRADGVDLQGATTVLLGSPIWLYSPAPPIWEFVRQRRFDGQDLILFNTFNSKFEEGYINEFRELALAQGARSFRHVFVKRGRMGQQLTSDEMLEKVNVEWTITDPAPKAASASIDRTSSPQ